MVEWFASTEWGARGQSRRLTRRTWPIFAVYESKVGVRGCVSGERRRAQRARRHEEFIVAASARRGGAVVTHGERSAGHGFDRLLFSFCPPLQRTALHRHVPIHVRCARRAALRLESMLTTFISDDYQPELWPTLLNILRLLLASQVALHMPSRCVPPKCTCRLLIDVPRRPVSSGWL